MELAPSHVMASGALPPAFPAVRIDGELYWDGGILSNTPTERIFDDHPRRNSLIFAVHLWNPTGEEPETIWEILNRTRTSNIRAGSRATSCASARPTSSAMSSPSCSNSCRRTEKNDPLYQELAGYRCDTRMHVVRLLARGSTTRPTPRTSTSRPQASATRWEAGYADTMRALEQQAWIGEFGLLDGVVLHEPAPAPSQRPRSSPDEPQARLVRRGPHKLAAE